jgi:hypothetical protein
MVFLNLNLNEYDPPFYFTPALNEESIGFSFMKTF